jgi:long-chain fatty acid transport protein
MARGTLRTVLLSASALSAVALGTLTLASVGAQAGGFAIREQSTYFQGMSFAGAAAGGSGSISSMFWNPATLSQAPLGVTVENSATGIFADSVITPSAATNPFVPGLLGLGGSGNIAQDAFVPAGYIAINPGGAWSFGASLNGPFGLVTQPRMQWAGMFYARESKVVSYNVTPQAAYKVNEWISVGVGAQFQYMKVRLDSAFPGSVAPGGAGFAEPDTLSLKADGFDVGFTAGVNLTPTPWTSIGIGYRYGINQSIEGNAQRPAFIIPPPPLLIAFPAAGATIRTTIPLPDTITLGIRQKLTESFTVFGTAEYTTWSRFGTVPVELIPTPSPPGIPTALPFGWRDGWFASVGAEYQVTPTFAVRGGVGYEESPVTDAVRTPRLPDNNRIWASGGLSWAYSERLTFDFAYTHIFVDDAPIDLTPGSGNPTFNPALGTFVGVGRTDIDIVSVGVRFKFSAPPKPVLVTKG